MNSNPWQVDSIWDFSFLHCPECQFNTQNENFFQTHAEENHPLSYVLFSENVTGAIFCDFDIQVLPFP